MDRKPILAAAGAAFFAIFCVASQARATSMFVAPVPAVRGSVSQAEADALSRAIESAVLARVIGIDDVVTPSALDAKLEIDLAKACTTGDDASCVVDFAQSLGVQYVMRSQLARLDGVSMLTISLYDGKRASLLGQGTRRANETAQLLEEVRPLVAEVAQAAGLSVVVERPKPSAVPALIEIVSGSGLFLASAATHAVALFVIEPGYQRAEFTRDDARTWEGARVFAYGLPVLGYIAGATLVGVGIYSWPSSSEGE